MKRESQSTLVDFFSAKRSRGGATESTANKVADVLTKPTSPIESEVITKQKDKYVTHSATNSTDPNVQCEYLSASTIQLNMDGATTVKVGRMSVNPSCF